MQTLLILDIEPAVLAKLLQQLAVQGSVLAIRAGADLPGDPPAAPLAPPIRALLTGYGLTARQCDVVLLDLQGLTRTDIAIRCGITPLTVKKYWRSISTRLGLQRRQSIREWVLAQYTQSEGPLPFELPDNFDDYPPNCPPNYPLKGDCSAPAPATILETKPHQPVEQ
jgi:DNA-binding CsgD family transcriptional regulator